MSEEYFSVINGENLYQQAKRINSFNSGTLRYELERRGICGLGMFNDQIPSMLAAGLPLTFCYKYGGGQMAINPNGGVFFEEGHDEEATVEKMVNDFEEIFEAPLEKVAERAAAA